MTLSKVGRCRRREGLVAGDVCGMMSLLVPAARRFSPAWGLMATACPTLGCNLYRCETASRVWGLAPSCLLTREIFQELHRGDGIFDIRPTASQSRAINHCSHLVLGEILGMAERGGSPAAVESMFRSHGISSNRLRGEWTGVSLARYARLHSLLSEALRCDPGPPGLATFLRFVWSKARDMNDIWDFLEGMAKHMQVFPVDRTVAQAQWKRERQDAAVDWPAPDYLALLRSSSDSTTIARQVEFAAYDLARATQFKPALRIRKQRFRVPSVDSAHRSTEGDMAPFSCSVDIPLVSDCVEVAIREVIEFIIEEPSLFDRLAPAMNKQLTDFLRAAVAVDADEDRLSDEWFQLCQATCQAHCEFLASHEPSGLKYELAPGTVNVARACGVFLCGTDTWTSLKAPLESWGFSVSEAASSYRWPAAEETRHKETVTIRSPTREKWIEIDQERTYPLAKVTHRAPARAQNLEEARHAIASRSGTLSESDHGECGLGLAWLTEAAIAGDRKLLSIGAAKDPQRVTPKDCLKAIFFSRRASDRASWQPLESTSHVAEGKYHEVAGADRDTCEHAILAVEVASAARAKDLLPWLLQDLPLNDRHVDGLRLGHALRWYPELRSSEAQRRPSMQAAIEGRVSLSSLLHSPIRTARWWLRERNDEVEKA